MAFRPLSFTHNHRIKWPKNSNKYYKGNLKKLHPGFIWDEDAKGRYTIGIKSREVKDRIQNLAETNSFKCINIANEI